MASVSEGQSGRRSGSRIIGRVLPGAVKLWLRSQVEQVEDLQVGLDGRDRDILSGALAGVSVTAQAAIYRGIHISELQLSAEDIQVNIGQVIRGKPLRLLKVFPVGCEVMLTASDLNASLGSDLLRVGLTDFWRSLVKLPALAESIEARYGALPVQSNVVWHDGQIQLGDGRLGLSFYPQVAAQTGASPVILGTGLRVIGGNRLQLENPRWLERLADVTNPEKGEPIELLQGFQWDLGSDTQLSELTVSPEKLVCAGQLRVNP